MRKKMKMKFANRRPKDKVISGMDLKVGEIAVLVSLEYGAPVKPDSVFLVRTTRIRVVYPQTNDWDHAYMVRVRRLRPGEVVKVTRST